MIRRLIGMLVAGTLGLSLGLAARAEAARAAEPLQCPPDAKSSGTICIDTYEASVWQVPSTNTALIKKIKLGTVTLSDLQGASATQLGLADGDLATAGCAASGNDCTNFYAVSIASVTPASLINWFQAVAVARNSGKRLPTNQEWQAAALGTPDPSSGTDDGSTECNISTAGAAIATGRRSACVSNVGAFDMVGNVAEWVADWIVSSIKGKCTDSSNELFSEDLNCLTGNNQSGGSGSSSNDVTVESGTNALYRGGAASGSASAGGSASGTKAGVFFVDHDTPTLSRSNVGFRAAR